MAEVTAAARVHTLEMGLACCAVEVAAARAVVEALAAPAPDAAYSRSPLPGEPGTQTGAAVADQRPVTELEVLVVAGTVTDAMAPLVRAEYDDLRARVGERLRVLSFGSCANTGGPYWDSYAVTKGIDQILPVDGYVPGCPPRPDLLRAALAELR